MLIIDVLWMREAPRLMRRSNLTCSNTACYLNTILLSNTPVQLNDKVKQSSQIRTLDIKNSPRGHCTGRNPMLLLLIFLIQIK
jgi:hypothetical protein